MRIDKLEIENFGPFYGRHEIRFSTSESSPVTLVHAENMRGKTTILNAIRWALYGGGKLRTDLAAPTQDFLNYDAIAEEKYQMGVVLHFEHTGEQLVLQRYAESEREPDSAGDLEVTVSLRRGGHFVPTDQVDEVIADILHPEVSRFFLFDGEMLDQFEVLLEESEYSTKLIKESIERILGLPALRFAVMDIDKLQREAAKRLRKEVEKQAEHEELIEKAEKAENEIESLEDDLGRLRGEQSKLEEKRAHLKNRRSKFTEIKADAQRLDALEERTEELEKERERLVTEIQHITESAWWEPVAPLAERLLEQAERRAEKLAEENAARDSLSRKISELERGQSSDKCPTCGEPLDETRRSEIERELSELKNRLAAMDDGGEAREQVDVFSRIKGLRRFADMSDLMLLQEYESRIRKMNIDERRYMREQGELEDRLRGHDRRDIQRVERALEKTIQSLTEVSEAISDAEERLQQRRTDLGRYQQWIEDLPEADPRIGAEASVYASLREIFDKAVSAFREELRLDVEREATRIFRALTTEEEYERLEINDQYGLMIVDERGIDIRQRSKGAEQVVALSLIGALNRCAVRDGPLVMDTPFGRLDVGHRRNILQFIPTLGTQVVLLVQSGELERERDLEHIQAHVGREYSLERDGAPTRSRIEQVV